LGLSGRTINCCRPCRRSRYLSCGDLLVSVRVVSISFSPPHSLSPPSSRYEPTCTVADADECGDGTLAVTVRFLERPLARPCGVCPWTNARRPSHQQGWHHTRPVSAPRCTHCGNGRGIAKRKGGTNTAATAAAAAASASAAAAAGRRDRRHRRHCKRTRLRGQDELTRQCGRRECARCRLHCSQVRSSSADPEWAFTPSRLSRGSACDALSCSICLCYLLCQ
jgi:hypothetical protein